jgi:hypothetical protein
MSTLQASIAHAIKQGLKVAAVEALIDDYGQSQLMLTRNKHGLAIASRINEFNAILLGRLPNITPEELETCFTQLIESREDLGRIKYQFLDTLSEWRCKIEIIISEPATSEHFTVLGDFAQHHDIAVAQLNAVNLALADIRTK